MTLEHAMHGVLDRTLTRILAPRVRPTSFHNPFHPADPPSQWAYKLPLPFLQRTEAAFNEFESHLKRLINARRAAAALGDVREGAAGKKDLLGALIYANVPDEEEEDKEDAKKKAKLTDEEVLGNVFGIMIAGHGESRSIWWGW